MKLPITDQFLWSIYEFFEMTDDLIDASEIFKVRSFRNICAGSSNEFWRALNKKKQKKQFSQFINYLKRKGYIKIANLKGKQGILLTQKGSEKVLKAKIQLTTKRKRKDGKWIMLMYDVPEKRRKDRDFLRDISRSLGFQELQKSILVSPYDVSDELEKMLATYSLDQYVKVFLIEEINL